MIKRIFTLFVFCLVTTLSLSASTSVEPNPEVDAARTTITTLAPAPADVDIDACTLSGEFTTEGGATYEVTVTAPTCGGAARVLQAVGDAIDQM